MIKEFIDKYGTNLVVEYNKTNIIFKTNDKNIKNNYVLKLYFDENVFKELINNLKITSEQIWNNFNPKVADSISSDYSEYYDRKYDNNGYLNTYRDFSIRIEKPDKDTPYMYKFNKRRMESFIYDFIK